MNNGEVYFSTQQYFFRGSVEILVNGVKVSQHPIEHVIDKMDHGVELQTSWIDEKGRVISARSRLEIVDTERMQENGK